MRIATFGILAGLCLGSPTPLRAADLDFSALRGGSYDAPAAAAGNWDGAYFGAHGGWSSANFGFSNVFQPMVANYTRATAFETALNVSTLLRPQSVRRDTGSFGAYAGLNIQYDEFIFGGEIDYTYLGLTGRTTDFIGRSNVTDGMYRAAVLSGSAATKIEDYATIRARFGYDAGNFMPFVTGGFAVGRAQVADRVEVQLGEYDQATYRSNLGSATPAYVFNSGYRVFDQANPGTAVLASPVVLGRTKERIVGGIAAGAGLEFALTANILLRGEYQYVMFDDFDGHKSHINTVRGGAAVKF
ncbi:outer membrane protein [Methylobacterium isbiliense]|uniref:Outer membrane protein beta-barrel domain-containing protein n=1 Tax=Methylobacterium isbiliense TaxID=315478 RepID=A0ABQ4SAX4_9HYPH|nr:outer membrane beta-barrel protein [Methylobacterium isbiliense]MDN3622500.1 outer membrane beta-barrel protein [Methylobacterium isbiliense]GJD99302.1 hypothetical protein GMJLKIPL_1218 [Methylobacterium isbiliense]